VVAEIGNRKKPRRKAPDKELDGVISSTGEEKKRRKPIFTIIISVIAILILVIYLSVIGIGDVAEILFGANLWLIGLSIVLIYLSLFLDFTVWYDMLRRIEPSTKLLSSFQIYLMAFTVGYLIPSAGASNIAARQWMCSKEEWGKTCGGPKLFSTIMAHTLVGFVTFIVSVIIALAGLYFIEEFHVSLTIMLMLVALLVVLIIIVIELIIIFTNSQKLISLISKLRRFLRKVPVLKNHTSILEDIDDKIHSLTQHFTYFFKNRKLFLGYFAIVMLSRVIIWLAIYVALLSIGLDMIPFMLVVIASIIIMLLAFIPLGIPGMEGIKEIVLSEIFLIVLDTREISAAAGIISNVDFYFTVFVGAVLYILWGIKQRKK